LKINFEHYSDENKYFIKQIESNIEAVLKLESEYAHEKYIESFEKEFAEYNGSAYAIAVNSGTTALELALKASGIKENDEVILPSYTYISTALAVSNLGAVPVFADIKESTFTIDPKEIEDKLTKRTRAILPVHIHGNSCEMNKIIEIAKENNLAVVEDCSHAHGAEYDNKKVGNFGMGCFSCHSGKVLSGIGNGGLITVNDKEINDAIKIMLRVKNDPETVLSNRTPCTLDSIQAAILKAKLPYLDKIIERKRKIANDYIETLPGHIKNQIEEKRSKHVYRDFVILTEERERIKSYLEQNEIETKIRYALPAHLTEYYKYLRCGENNLPVTGNISKQALCLPIFFALSKKEINYIALTFKNQCHAVA